MTGLGALRLVCEVEGSSSSSQKRAVARALAFPVTSSALPAGSRIRSGPAFAPTPTRPDAETLSTLTVKFGRPTATMPTWSAASRNLK